MSEDTNYAINDFKKELLEGNFNKAVKIQNVSKLPSNDIKLIANTVYFELMTQRKYQRAMELAKSYNLSSEKINDAINKNFGLLFGKHEYEAAANWASEYKLPSSEKTKAATKIFETLIQKRDIKGALEAIEKYNISHDLIADYASTGFNNAFQREDYLDAALLGKKFNLSRKRILLSAVYAFKKYILKEDWGGFTALENEFNIISDSTYNEISEKERGPAIDIFFKNAVQKTIKRGNVKLITDILDSTGILNRKYSTVALRELVNNILVEIAYLHNMLLTGGNEKDAIEIKDHFELLEPGTPADVKNSVIETAQAYHNMLLKKYLFEEAKAVKINYALFDKNIVADSLSNGLASTFEFFENSLSKGDFNLSLNVSKEYNIPKEKLEEITTNVIIDKLNKLQFEEAFLILKKFKLGSSSEKLMERANEKFYDAINNNHFEIASELGRLFNLDGKKTRESAYKAWIRYIKNGKYDKAFQITKLHKLPNSWTHNVAEEIYQYNLQISRADIAKKIRTEYNLEYSFFDRIIEFLKRFILRK